VAIAVFTSGEIVETLFADVALLSCEIVVAFTFALAIARDSVGALTVALARQAFGVFVISRAALVARFPSEVHKTGAFSGRAAA
jgi:hypothetical protein